jgi:GNAT superfamily N-acetyltransferase
MKKEENKARSGADIKKEVDLLPYIQGDWMNNLSKVIVNWFGQEVYLELEDYANHINFLIIFIDSKYRGTGFAEEVITEIKNYADYTGKVVIGTPNKLEGKQWEARGVLQEKPILDRFYEKNGFRKTTLEEREKYRHEYIYTPK